MSFIIINISRISEYINIWDFPGGTVVENPPAMQGTWVRSLVKEAPTCRRATKPVHHNYWACALEPARLNYWAHKPQLLKPTCSRAHVPQLPSPRAATTKARAPRAGAPQQEKPLQWEAHAPQWEAHAAQWRVAPPPGSLQLEKACAQQRKHSIYSTVARITKIPEFVISSTWRLSLSEITLSSMFKAKR